MKGKRYVLEEQCKALSNTDSVQSNFSESEKDLNYCE